MEDVTSGSTSGAEALEVAQTAVPEATPTVDTDPTVEPEQGFSGRKTAEVVGISYRQLDYWARTELVTPSLAEARGSGSRRLYSYRDLLELKVIKNLLDAGIKLESVRKAFTYMREHMDADIAAAHLVLSGGDVMICDGDQLVDVMNRAGQGVLVNVLALGGVKSSLDDQIQSMEAAAEPAAATPLHRRAV